MYELIAIGVGVAIGFALSGAPTLRRGIALALPLAFVGGATVTAMSGELEVSAGFVLFDVGQTALAAVLTLVLVRAVRRRPLSDSDRL